MAIETIQTDTPEASEALNLGIDGKLNALSDFSQEFPLEKQGFKELLPDLEAKDTFTATKFIEDVCSRNEQARSILNIG